MNIEPCPFCGGTMGECSGVLICNGCSYQVHVFLVEKHNHLSRIVRAAEEYVTTWHKVLDGIDNHEQSMEEYGAICDDHSNAYDSLFEAVEGGRADEAS